MERAQAGVTVADPSQPHIVRSDADDIDLRPELLLEIHVGFASIIARMVALAILSPAGLVNDEISSNDLFALDTKHPDLHGKGRAGALA